jgi:starch synthase
MEAMSSGLPSISARVAGIPDIIQDRITGLLIDPEISEQLADAIQSIIDDPSFADHIAHAGYDHIQAHFRLDACLDPLLLLFRQALHSSDTVAPTLSV